MMDSGKEFNPSRLLFARERREITQVHLAERLGVTSRTVKSYENADPPPSEEVLHRVARVLDFPVSFFYEEDLEPITPESASFRSFTKVSRKLRSRAIAAGTIGLELARYLGRQFTLPPPNVPDLRERGPAGAAEALRQAWGIGQQPIDHVIRLLERNGVRVFALSEDCDAIDAFSLWRDGVPYVFLNTRKSSERSIFDAAHELGHLTMHRHGAPNGQAAEAEADQFAANFLMPAAGFLASASTLKTMAGVLATKRRWRTSAAATIRRLRDVGRLTDWDYRRLNIELSRNNRAQEPQTVPRESSVLLRKAMQALADEGITVQRIAAELHVPTWEIRVLTFGFGTVEGHGPEGASNSPPRRGHLRLVG